MEVGEQVKGEGGTRHSALGTRRSAFGQQPFIGYSTITTEVREAKSTARQFLVESSLNLRALFGFT
jgi:hypothetical protein